MNCIYSNIKNTYKILVIRNNMALNMFPLLTFLVTTVAFFTMAVEHGLVMQDSWDIMIAGHHLIIMSDYDQDRMPIT